MSNIIAYNKNQFNGKTNINLVEVLLKDKETGDIIGSKLMKMAAIHKSMQPLSDISMVIVNGKFVIEV